MEIKRVCSECDHQLEETQRFCANCGTPVNEDISTPAPASKLVSSVDSEETLAQSKPVEPPIELYLTRPFMIGERKGIPGILGLVYFILFLYTMGNIWFSLIFIAAFLMYMIDFSKTPSREKSCPSCNQMNKYLVTTFTHQCPSCKQKFNLKWH
jgi:RNA polymerase subunit RPABC4/transcription elongation factor Spt4